MSLIQLLFSLLIFTLPLNLFLKGGIEQAYVNGLLIDYLIPKLYLSDLILWLLLLSWVLKKVSKNELNLYQRLKPDQRLKQAKKLKNKTLKSLNQIISKNNQPSLKKTSFHQFYQRNRTLKILGLLTTLLLIRQLFTPRPISSLWFSMQLLEMGLLAVFLIKQKKLLSSKFTQLSFVLAFTFQALLAARQFFLQQPLLPYQFLGEPSFRSYLQLHRQSVWGQSKILAYGSTAHPNVLAGLAVLFFLIILRQLDNLLDRIQVQHKSHWPYTLIKGLSLLTVLAVLFFTQSISALFCLIIGLMIEIKNCRIIKKKNLTIKSDFPLDNLRNLMLLIIIFLTPVLIAAANSLHNSPSLDRRNALNQAAIKIWLEQPLFGTGLNQLTVNLEKKLPYRVLEGFVQPTHHVPLLLLAETGIFGVILIALLWKKIPLVYKKSVIESLLTISPILVLDHYLYTLQTGQLLLIFWIMHSIQLKSAQIKSSATS